MKFCSECGATVESRVPELDARVRHVCLGCGFVHYDNPRVIVGCYAHWRKSVAFVQRRQPPDAGRWMIPSGFLEHGETLQQAAVREVFEECGLAIDSARLDLYAVWSMPPIGQVGVSFRVALESEPSLQPGAECTAASMLDESRVPFDSVAWAEASILPMRTFFAELAQGRFAVHLRELGPSGAVRLAERSYGA